MELEPGDIILSHEVGSNTSGIIAAFSGCYWSHTSLYLGDGLIIESIRTGVHIIPFNEAMDNCNFIVLRCNYLLSSKKKLIIEEAVKFEGEVYDFGSYTQILKKLIGKKDKFQQNGNSILCSHLVDKIYKNIGFDLF